MNDPSTAPDDTEEMSLEATGSFSVFIPQQGDLPTKGYEEGYDVYIDKQYVAQLQLHQLEALPHDMSILVRSSLYFVCIYMYMSIKILCV